MSRPLKKVRTLAGQRLSVMARKHKLSFTELVKHLAARDCESTMFDNCSTCMPCRCRKLLAEVEKPT